MIKNFIIFFTVVSLISMPFYGTAAAEVHEWKNKVNIDKELVIEPDNQINVTAGSTIEVKKKIDILGKLSIKGSEKQPVTIVIPNQISNYTTLSIKEQTLLKTNDNLTELEIYPYKVDTKEVVDELRAFRYQYAFVWTVLMGVCFYLVLNRSTYW